MGVGKVTPQAKELGGDLRRARLKAGLTEDELAGKLGCSASKISRLEHGKRRATEFDVTTFLAHCGASRKEILRVLELARETEDSYRLRPHREKLPDELSSLITHETTASSITVFEPQLIPGILQTEAYARALFRLNGTHDEDNIEIRVAARLTRQELLRRHDRPRFAFFIHEHPLLSVVGDEQVMHEQMLHLVLAGHRTDCDIRVIPTDAFPPGIFGPSFWLMNYEEHKPIIYTQTYTASVFLQEQVDVAAYNAVLSRVAEVALDARQSQERFATLASTYDVARIPDDSPTDLA